MIHSSRFTRTTPLGCIGLLLALPLTLLSGIGIYYGTKASASNDEQMKTDGNQVLKGSYAAGIAALPLWLVGIWHLRNRNRLDNSFDDGRGTSI